MTTQGIVSGSITIPPALVPPVTNPLVVRPGAFRVRMARIFTKTPFRDTVTHDGRFMIQMVDNSDIFFEVVNTHDQAVTVELVTGSCGGYVGATRIGLPETIAANQSEGFTVAADSTWGPWIGIQINFAVAPTSGFVTVMMSQRELQLR